MPLLVTGLAWYLLMNAPPASTEATRRSMRGNRRKDTLPELRLRRSLFALGLRYRVDYPVRPDEGRPIRVDIAFTRVRLAVFVDGCFWHGCPSHGVMPRTNRDYWGPKIERNIERDNETTRRLEAAGWVVARFWEHDDPTQAAEAVMGLIARTGPLSTPRR